MTNNRVAIALSFAALVVAGLAQTSLGQAAASGIRVALFAQNAGRVNDIQAARSPVPGRLLALDAKGQFPPSVLPSGAGPAYTHTIVVHPGDDPAKAGTELIRALGGITDNAGTNPYLVKIEPGIYDLGTGSLTMKPYVDVEGSGEGVTTLTSAVSTGAGTIIGADHSELRFLTVKNVGGGQHSIALFSESTSPRYTHVTALSTGGTDSFGVHVSNGSPVLTNVTSTGSGSGQSIGLANYNGNTTVLNSTLAASNAAGLNAGLLTTFGGSVRLVSSTLSASGGAIAIGMRSYNGSHSLANVTVTAGSSGQSYGIYNGQKSSTPMVTVQHSRVSGQTNSIFAFGGSVRVGATQLSGVAEAQVPGTVVCAASYDAAFGGLGSSCD